MDYRRRYLRRFIGNDNQQNKDEEKVIKEKDEDKPQVQNENLQKLLEKTKEVPKNSGIGLSSVNDLTSFKTNVSDILSKEENKQKAIKYLIHKRNEERFGARSPVIAKNEEEGESNPVLSNKYYKNSRNLNARGGNVASVEINRAEIITNNNNENAKPIYSHFYSRRNKNFISQEINQANLSKNENNIKKEEQPAPYIRRRFQASSSTKNINNNQNNNIENKDNSTNNSICQRKLR